MIIPNIAIHESVYDEISYKESIKSYVDEKINNSDGHIIILYDKDLTKEEELIRRTVEDKISIFTNYNASIDNRMDRGEVKSISFSIAKGYIYFSTNDSNVISLIERSELQTYLHSLGSIRLYELIYAIKALHGNSNILKGLYKLMYNLTKNEKRINPDWTTFIDNCYSQYGKYI